MNKKGNHVNQSVFTFTWKKIWYGILKWVQTDVKQHEYIKKKGKVKCMMEIGDCFFS